VTMRNDPTTGRTRLLRRSTASVLLAAVMALAAACSDEGTPVGDTRASPTVAAERPKSTASLSIDEPKDGGRVSGDSTRLVVRLQGGTVVDRTSTDLRPDEGHLHVVLDGKLVSMTSETSRQLTGLQPGQHLVQVEFVANDHAPFDPRVLAAATFEVT
jgi:Family of unknown function (DUF6130)